MLHVKHYLLLNVLYVCFHFVLFIQICCHSIITNYIYFLSFFLMIYKPNNWWIIKRNAYFIIKVIIGWLSCATVCNSLTKRHQERRAEDSLPSLEKRVKKRWFIFPADLGSLFVVTIIISESQCDTWEWIHSSIFFMHPSILSLILYLYLHWTYSWIISISFPSSHLSDTASHR